MCQRLLEQSAAIKRYAFEKERPELNLTDRQWELLEDVVNLLSPLEELTKLFCASSIAVQQPFAVMTREKVLGMVFRTQDIEAVREEIIIGLDNRFLHLGNSKLVFFLFIMFLYLHFY